MGASQAFSKLVNKPFEFAAAQREKAFKDLEVKRQQVALDLQEALEEFETTKTAAAKAEAASTSLLAEAMLSLQQAENDEAKKEVAGLEQELSRLREKAHEQDERAIGECMRLDAEFSKMKEAHPGLAFL